MITLTDADLIRAMAYLVAILLGGFSTIVWWAARWVVSKIESITAMFRDFDRRLTRVEARLGMVERDDPFSEPTYPGRGSSD